MFNLFIVLFFSALSTLAKSDEVNNKFDVQKGVVKISVQSSKYDFYRPWSSAKQQDGIGSGFVISGKKIVTNAHVVSNAIFIQITKAGDYKKYKAVVEAIFHDVDLAILKVEDDKFFDDVMELELDSTPDVGDEVKAYGYPIGGNEMSLTKGVISRTEILHSMHSNLPLLGCEMDTVIAPGSSGGPVIKGDKVVGISFQVDYRKSGGYIISVDVLKNCLNLYNQKSLIYKVPDLGIKTQNLENKDFRAWLNLGNIEGGVYIVKVGDLSAFKDILKEQDVLLAIDDYAIDEHGKIEFRPKERIDYIYTFLKKSIGETIKLRIFRKGTILNLEGVLKNSVNDVRYASEMKYDNMPEFLIRGGIVFQPFVGNLQFVDYKYIRYDFRTKERPDIVIMNKILLDSSTSGYNLEGQVLKNINGMLITNLNDIDKALSNNKSTVHKIELEDGSVVILNVKDFEENNKKICKNYGITVTDTRVSK